MVTCVDVAKKAKVSRATVTRVISEPDKVSKETREKVLKAMEELNYQPNLMASSLKSTRSKLIGFVIPDIVNPFYIEFAYELQRELKKHDYSLMIQLSNESSIEEQQCIRFLIGCRVEILLFSPIEVNANIQKNLSFYKSKTLQVFRKLYSEIDSVYIDDENGGYLAAKELLKNGHKEILLLETISNESTVSSRKKGMMRAFQEFGVPFQEEYYIPLNIFDFKEEDILEIFRKTKATAMIIVAYKLQEMVIHTLEKLHKKIKEDISLVFYDKTFFSQQYNVTTITHNMQELVETIHRYIIARINGTDFIHERRISPILQEGDSIKKIE